LQGKGNLGSDFVNATKMRSNLGVYVSTKHWGGAWVENYVPTYEHL